MFDSSNRAKPASVAAFLFLPQFGQMFRSSSHLVPTFIRTIARLFVQASLLPPTHPAALYGDPGVEKCSFTKMMGDAWHTLRSTTATPYQWSIYCSVLLMIFVFLVSSVSMVFNITNLIGSAAAQSYIFTNPLGPTDIQNMPGPVAPCTAQTPLCRVIPDAGSGYGDYAIDLLDKMLRLGANQTGGPLQNATGALMSIYNAGILFVAACLLFWLIISVVVDIAKTGQIGGGRHNLVWAPIRIVFALGMMVPLGTSGFSTGQFVVMKIAEWGSNFGSNGWNAYLTKVMSSANVIPGLSVGEALEPIVGSYERLWICKVAHNGYGYQAEGSAFNTPNLDQVVELRFDTGSIDKGSMSYAYTNATANDLCGRVTFPTGNDPTLQGTLNPPAGSTPNPVAQAEAKFKYAMDQAWMNLFINGYSPGMAATDPNTAASNLDNGLQIATLAKQFACGFVAQHIWGKVNGLDVLAIDCNGNQAPQCGSGDPGSGKYPDMSCVDNPTDEMDTGTMTGVIGSAIYNAAQNNLSQLKNIPATALFGTRGWADMGSFYKAITTLTTTVKYAQAVPVKISAPSVQDSGDNQAEKVQEVMAKFDDWLDTVPNGQPAPNPPQNCSNDPPPPGCNTRTHHGWNPVNAAVGLGKAAVGAVKGAVKGTFGMLEEAKKMAAQVENYAKDPAGLLLAGASKMSSDYQGGSFLGIPDPKDPAHVNDYPLQILSSVGVTIMKIATYIYIAITALEILLGILPTESIGVTVADSMLSHLINTLSDTLMGCGFILVYYLPMMPYIRVAHAVLTWMIAVFEAVMLVPIACLSFLDTEKEGMYNKMPFVNWLDILVRPILTVIGYVGAVLVFDAFFGYLQASFAGAAGAEVSDTGVLNHFIALFANAVLFTFVAYTSANASFKMISLIPDAFFRWLPGGQASGASHIEAPNGAGPMQQMGGMAGKGMNTIGAGARGGGQVHHTNTRYKKGNDADRKAMDSDPNKGNTGVSDGSK